MFAWSELHEDDSAMFAFAIQKEDDGHVLHSAICGNGLLLLEGMKGVVEDNPEILEILKAVVDFYECNTDSFLSSN